MNDAQHAAYKAYLQELARLLLLQDWEVELLRDRPNVDHAWAQVHVADSENYFSVKLAWPDCFARPLEEQREWMVHEVLHVHLDRADRIMGKLSEMFPDNSATTLARKLHIDEVEVAVQRLARILAPFMPMPPVVEEKKS